MLRPIGHRPAAAKAAAFFVLLLVSFVDWLDRLGITRADSTLRRAEWLSRWVKVYLAIIGLRVLAEGTEAIQNRPSQRGLLIIANHVSYLDVLVLASLTPCVFVAKKEVHGWPLFGLAAKCGGTIFVDRTRKSAVAAVAEAMESALKQGVNVVLFPEGTSTDGHHVLPFKSPLLEPIVRTGSAVIPVAIAYQAPQADPATELCYWGDMTLIPHLWNVFRKTEIQAHVVFGVPEQSRMDRKTLAQKLHVDVCQLLESARSSPRSVPPQP